MDVKTDKKLLNIVGPYLTKQKCIRNPPPNTYLEIYLRYLATGETYEISFLCVSQLFKTGVNRKRGTALIGYTENISPCDSTLR